MVVTGEIDVEVDNLLVVEVGVKEDSGIEVLVVPGPLHAVTIEIISVKHNTNHKIFVFILIILYPFPFSS